MKFLQLFTRNWDEMLSSWFRNKTKWVFLNKYMADPKAYRLEISGPGLRFVVTYMRSVRTQTGLRISRLRPATETKSGRSEFIVRPLSCKRIKRNCLEADTNSCRFELVAVLCKYPQEDYFYLSSIERNSNIHFFHSIS